MLEKLGIPAGLVLKNPAISGDSSPPHPDVVMPEISGRVLAEQSTRLRPQVRVLYMSGYIDDAVLRHGVMSAAMNFIDKPFTPERMARTIRDVLDGTRD